MSSNTEEPIVMTEDERLPGRIEGGIDAIVIGAGADGLTAASYLGRAGLKTVLVGARGEIGGRIAERNIAENISVIDGEHLVTNLDPDVIDELDLYRHGLEFSSRRLDTTYFFDGGDVLKFDGNPSQAALLSLEEDNDRENFEIFLNEMLELSEQLRPLFSMSSFSEKDGGRKVEKLIAALPSEMTQSVTQAIMGNTDTILKARLGESPLRVLLLTEAAFRSGVPPFEAYSFMNLIRRFSGEAAGLQGAVAYPKGGVISVITALRRAAQQANVDVRAATPVQSILIEADRVAGVTLKDGGQLRAPIVVAAIDAQRTFIDMIGPKMIDIELQRMLTAGTQKYCSARLHVLLKGVAEDDATRQNLTRRLVFAPTAEDLATAFIDARAGRVPKKLILEAVFPSALDEGASLDKKQLLSVIAHPLPFEADPSDDRRDEIKKAILQNLEAFAADISDRAEITDLQLPADEVKNSGATPGALASKPDILQQWAISRTVTDAARIGGLFFCGPEAQIGSGISCAAGRAAAKAALRAYKKGGA